jgi:hypothetical protein
VHLNSPLRGSPQGMAIEGTYVYRFTFTHTYEFVYVYTHMHNISALKMTEFYLNYKCIDGKINLMPQKLHFTPGKDQDEGEYCEKNGRSSPDTVAF